MRRPSRVIAVRECPDCGDWLDVPYEFLDRIYGGWWLCPGCAGAPRQMAGRVVALTPVDARLYDLWVAGQPAADAEIAAGVRPVLEPLL